MATTFHIATRAARRAKALLFVPLVALALLAAAADCSADGGATHAQRAAELRVDGCYGRRAPVQTTETVRSRGAVPTPSYGWPLKPFDRQHPIRAYFNDPRMHHTSRAFHFGIDIAAPNGAPVYAVAAGTAHLQGGRAIAVVEPGGARTFSYWHVVPAVAHRSFVHVHQLIGHVESPWEHVHFAELSGREYRNPLRPGALGPYSDSTAPTIADIQLTSAEQETSVDAVSGLRDLVVEAFDTTPLPVRAPWAAMPVTPVFVSWRISRDGERDSAWRVAVDFRSRMLPARDFYTVYAKPTRQNHPGKQGRYCFYLARDWDSAALPDGDYRIDVQATDTGGNRTVATLPIHIANQV